MKLHKKKRIASRLLKVGKNKVIFDPENLEEISGAITRRDMGILIKQGVVKAKKTSSQSRSRARAQLVRKSKGRKQGTGSRKGTKKTRNPPKKLWMGKIRLLRSYLLKLKKHSQISNADYHLLRAKSKGGFFRSQRHLKLYIQERGMIKEDGN